MNVFFCGQVYVYICGCLYIDRSMMLEIVGKREVNVGSSEIL